MKKAVDSQVNCDRTFRAKVTEIVQTDKIRVLHNGKTYTVYSSIFCEVDDMVRVCVPCGNWKELYVIENRSKGKTLRDLYQKVGVLENKFGGYLPLTGGNLTGVISPVALQSQTKNNAEHNTNFYMIPYVAYQSIQPDHDTVGYLKSLLIWICKNYPKVENGFFMGICCPNSQGLVFINIYNTSDIQDGFPRYSSGLYLSLDAQLYIFRTHVFNFSHKIL